MGPRGSVREALVVRKVRGALKVLGVASAMGAVLAAQQPQTPAPQTPSFRSAVDLVLVDVVVRDRKGAVVKGLTADDFELVEDGRRQQILTFAYEEISNNAQ